MRYTIVTAVTPDVAADRSIRVGLLPDLRENPFDRTLISRAQGEIIRIVTNKRIFGTYGVRRVW
jgi:PIN domain nuclease of toxin-antitoxin system